MQYVVNIPAIIAWEKQNEPQATEKLAARSEVSASLWRHAKRGLVPRDAGKRSKMAQALGLKTDDLFPPQGDEAS